MTPRAGTPSPFFRSGVSLA
ncbi:Putative Phenylalanine--tRNA ligase operon leader peptide [Deinococcus deserti]|uniref:Putative Phenylalanine--tRNA ligase operon leader peptide n=1 Tax=Deinococcus deserti (strain DSM 17065 / CIP 109153 / LMG 22923 / VCD115) TaxID=546414 RepID=X5H5S1_DEIDV|nr:putative Phenylalanine--tRNA ligase operon leader peptide [Deinococcus deserti VCD115]